MSQAIRHCSRLCGNRALVVYMSTVVIALRVKDTVAGIPEAPRYLSGTGFRVLLPAIFANSANGFVLFLVE